MFVTVAICTWNRAALLDQTLTAMHNLVIPEGMQWELLVVNNNCTDDTDNVIARHAAMLPIRGLHEPTPGKSHALNCAIGSARGKLIIWTDDDVLVDPEWISAYSQAADSYRDVSFFGGQVLPWFEGCPPQWLQEHWRQVECAFAVRDLGDESIPFSPRVVPVGANFAVRTEVQRQYLYNPDLGYRPGSRMAGEETTLVRQMLADGLQGALGTCGQSPSLSAEKPPDDAIPHGLVSRLRRIPGLEGWTSQGGALVW